MIVEKKYILLYKLLDAMNGFCNSEKVSFYSSFICAMTRKNVVTIELIMMWKM
jgi:hypothetical protein